MTRRRHFRFVGGEHDGKWTPPDVWLQEDTRVNLPVVPKPKITVYDDYSPVSVSEGPSQQTYELRRLLVHEVDLELEAWVAVGFTASDVLQLVLEELLDRDAP